MESPEYVNFIYVLKSINSKGYENYTFQNCKFHSNKQKELLEFREDSMKWLYRNSEFQFRDNSFYKKILVFVNPNSGKGLAKKSF